MPDSLLPPSGSTGSPLDQRLAWFVAAVNAPDQLSDASITAHIAPSLLPEPRCEEFRHLIGDFAHAYGRLELQHLVRPPTATQAIAVLTTTSGVSLSFALTVEVNPPHRVTALMEYPFPVSAGDDARPGTTAWTGRPAEALCATVSGRQLVGSVSGSGPTVVLEAGLSDSAATWAGLLPALAATGRLVSYDRPNTTAGASDPATRPRTADDAVTDLQALLLQAGLPGPYVLVGHSIGGLFVRLFAYRYPDLVAGLVLVDATHEAHRERLQALLPAEVFAAHQCAEQEVNTEGIDLAGSAAQLEAARRAAPPLTVPQVVLTAGRRSSAVDSTAWDTVQEHLWSSLQKDLATQTRQSRHVMAPLSGHFIQQDQPELIVEAVRSVIAADRNHRTTTAHQAG